MYRKFDSLSQLKFASNDSPETLINQKPSPPVQTRGGLPPSFFLHAPQPPGTTGTTGTTVPEPVYFNYCRVRSTTPAEDRYIVLSAKRNRCTTAQQVANQFLAASGKQISRKTVARRLRGGGLYARRPVVCVPLTRQHHTARLQWCREHHNWTEQDWACVLFSDESRFSLSSDCRRQLIWRQSGTAYRPENIQEKDRYPTCSIMVWAGIMINGRTRLHVVANGTMTGQRYIDEVLLPHVRLFLGVVGDKFVFMDDNATCHRTLAVQDCLDSENIQRLVWPTRSPDLNPIENVWAALWRQVAG
ncbi:transposable element Tc1 transposase [Trichonephila clavipes]|nr:transposable element Tc1 transposase [Trichonephila clavipes]